MAWSLAAPWMSILEETRSQWQTQGSLTPRVAVGQWTAEVGH